MQKRHRKYGYNAPACDIDCIQYDRGRPVAVIEWKHWKARLPNLDHPTARVKQTVASALEVPLFYQRVWPDQHWECFVTPVGALAEQYIEPGGVLITERDWVELLYAVRSRPYPDDAEPVGLKISEQARAWAKRYKPDAKQFDDYILTRDQHD